MKLWGHSGSVNYDTCTGNNILVYFLLLIAFFIGLLLFASKLHRQLLRLTAKAFCNILTLI